MAIPSAALAYRRSALMNATKITVKPPSEEILKARDIETRYLNYPTKRNYKQDDLERIIYGK